MLLEIPLKGEIKLKAGDTVYLSGEMVTARDMAHRRLVDEGAKPPADFNTVYHCGPLVKRENGWKMISCGPTTSYRMDRYTKAMVEQLGTRLFIGKGGMGKESRRIIKDNNCAYLTFTGGAGVLAAKSISIKDVHWLDLGLPEAVWVLEADNFGPLLVTIDPDGDSLY